MAIQVGWRLFQTCTKAQHELGLRRFNQVWDKSAPEAGAFAPSMVPSCWAASRPGLEEGIFGKRGPSSVSNVYFYDCPIQSVDQTAWKSSQKSLSHKADISRGSMFCIPSFDEMTNLTSYFNHVIPAYAGIQTVSHSASQVEEISETGSKRSKFLGTQSRFYYPCSQKASLFSCSKC